MKATAPLLITASLDAGNTRFVALKSTQARVAAHMQGLVAWLRNPAVERIVFAKNCPLVIRTRVLTDAAARYGKELEFVQTHSSPRTLLQGKGYGEGDLISQALKMSGILRQSRDFVKITGKLYCSGIEDFFSADGEGEGKFFVSTLSPGSVNPVRKLVAPLYRHPGGSASLAFLKRIRIPWGLIAAIPGGLVDTRLYRVNRKFYETVLLGVHERVQDALGYNLEMVFHDDLLGHRDRIRTIPTSPAIIGISGSLGTTAGSYPPEILEEARELASALIA